MERNTLPCRWTRSRLPLLAGGDLLGFERRRVERHLVGCPECRRQLASMQAALDVLRMAATCDPAPSSPAASIWPELSRQIRESRRPRRTVWPRLLAWPGAALAASLLLTLGGVTLFRRHDPGPTAVVTKPQRPKTQALVVQTDRADEPDQTDGLERPRRVPFEPPVVQDTH